MASTDGRGADDTTSEPISGCLSQIVCRTERRDCASRVSSNRGRLRGRPWTSLALDFLEGRAICRGRGVGERCGDNDIRSSCPSSSALRFRLLIFEEGELAMECISKTTFGNRLGIGWGHAYNDRCEESGDSEGTERTYESWEARRSSLVCSSCR